VTARSGPALQRSSDFNPKDLTTVDWRPPAHCFRPFTRTELLSKFPQIAYQATGIEIITREGEADLSFICKLHKELQCRWNAVFARFPCPEGESNGRYQLLEASTKGSFTHSHPIEKQSSLVSYSLLPYRTFPFSSLLDARSYVHTDPLAKLTTFCTHFQQKGYRSSAGELFFFFVARYSEAHIQLSVDRIKSLLVRSPLLGNLFIRKIRPLVLIPQKLPCRLDLRARMPAVTVSRGRIAQRMIARKVWSIENLM